MSTTDLEEMLAHDMETEEQANPTKKEVKRHAPKKVSATKTGVEKLITKQQSTTRPVPRPYKKMCSLKLTAKIEQLQHKEEEIETKLKITNIQLRKLWAEEEMRMDGSGSV